MQRVKILVAPSELKTVNRKVVEYLNIHILNYEKLFLNLSKDLEEYVRELAEGAPYNLVIEALREVISGPFTTWLSGVEDILKAIRGIALKYPKLELYCYKDPEFTRLTLRFAVEATLRILRWSITDRINPDEWARMISFWLSKERGAVEKEVKNIINEIDDAEDSLCIAGFEGRYLSSGIRSYGYDVDLEYMCLPYHFTPLEILLREIRMKWGSLDQYPKERLKRLIEEHAKFIKNYVVPNRDYEEAYIKWLADNVSWLKGVRHYLN